MRFLLYVNDQCEGEYATLAEAEDAASAWAEELRHDAISSGEWEQETVRVVEVLRDWRVEEVEVDGGQDAEGFRHSYHDLCDVSEGGREIDSLRKELDAACDAIHDLQMDHGAAVASERERIRRRMKEECSHTGWATAFVDDVAKAFGPAGELLPPCVLRDRNEKMKAVLLKLHSWAAKAGDESACRMIHDAVYG